MDAPFLSEINQARAAVGGTQSQDRFYTFERYFRAKVEQMLPSTLNIMGPIHMQSMKLLRPTVLDMHFQENT